MNYAEFPDALDRVHRQLRRWGVVGQDAEQVAMDLVASGVLKGGPRSIDDLTDLEIRRAAYHWRRAAARRRRAELHTANGRGPRADSPIDPELRELERVAVHALVEALRALSARVPADDRVAFARNVYGVGAPALAANSKVSAATWSRRVARTRTALAREIARRRLSYSTLSTLPRALSTLRRVLLRWARSKNLEHEA